MGLFTRQFVYARDRHGADCRHDSAIPGGQWLGGIRQTVCICLIWLVFGGVASGETLRIATYNPEMTDQGPGLVLQSLRRGDDPKMIAAVAVIVALNADVVLLTGIDYDAQGLTLAALAENLANAGGPYPFYLALRPNTGIATGLDLDGNGRLGEPRDAMGYGRYAGAAGMAVLSRYPIDTAAIRDFSGFLWTDLPNTTTQDPAPIRAVQRLSTTGMYEVPVRLPSGKSLRLLTYYATPPVFDGPEDRNGRRNHDETAFWRHLVDGALPYAAPAAPFVLLGQPNLDPFDGEGRPQALRAVLTHPALQDPAPRGTADRVDIGQSGDPAMDTALYAAIGGLRVELVLPSADLGVAGSGIMWPPLTDPLAATLALASRHRPVWVEVTLP